MQPYDIIRASVAQLFKVEEEPRPRGDRRASTEVYSGDFDRNEPPKDNMEKYWRIYETFPIVRESISAYAREVVEPGYYVECDSMKTAEELEEWLSEAAIIEGETKKDASILFKKSIIQREVRGTVLVEKVRGRETEKIVAIYLHNPEQFEVYTHPRSNILVNPDDTDLEDIPTTDDGEAAAYVQFDTSIPRWARKKEQGHETDIKFTKDEIIKITRDADVGEVFGTSRLESVADRIEALQNKLQDNDSAIASKAYPFWLFKFGTEDMPWEIDDINNFMEHHEMDKFQPSMKQGVSGDVDIDTISGDVADLTPSIEYDVNHIVTGMPTPRYLLGGFAENVNQFTAAAQENSMRRQIREARRELEAEFTPLLKEVAEERNLSDVESIRLKIGLRGQPDIQDPEGQNVIRYVSDSPQGGGDGPSSPRDAGSPEGDQDVVNDPPLEGPPEDPFEDEFSATFGDDDGEIENIWLQSIETLTGHSDSSNADCAVTDGGVAVPDVVEELNVDTERDQLALLGKQALENARDAAIQALAQELRGRENDGGEILSQAIRSAINEELRAANLPEQANVEIASGMRKTIEDLASGTGPVQLDIGYSFRHDQNARHYAENFSKAIEKAASDMERVFEMHVRRGAERGETWETVRLRIEDNFSLGRVDARSRIIADMELHNAIESTKLQEFDASPDVAGYKIVNPCTQNTTPLCRNLAGCGSGNGVEVRFDVDQSASEQLMSRVGDSHLFTGFAPIPPTPPFHYGCRSRAVPIPASGT